MFRQDDTKKESHQLFLVGFLLAGLAGFEPANVGVKVLCLTAWLQPIRKGWGDGQSPQVLVLKRSFYGRKPILLMVESDRLETTRG